MNDLLFTGDSVTDCSRKRALRYDLTAAGLGNGWVARLANTLQSVDPESRIWNRGYSGSLTSELMLQLDWWPQHEGVDRVFDVATLMIGINDIWHPFWKKRPHQLDDAIGEFESIVRRMKARAKSVIVCEPLALRCGEVGEEWWPLINNLSQRQRVVCEQLGVHWLGWQSMLQDIAAEKESAYLDDGVHPTAQGHDWLAQQWLMYYRNLQLDERNLRDKPL